MPHAELRLRAAQMPQAPRPRRRAEPSRPAGVGRGAAAARGGLAALLRGGDHATVSAVLAGLQRSHGNVMVQRLVALAVQRDDGDGPVEQVVPAPPLTGQGDPGEFEVEGGCDGLVLHGQANASYNGGAWSVAGQRVTSTTPCDTCPPGTQCLHLTGTLVSNYRASVTITMPSVPAGLTACEATKVRAFLRDVLAPHEREHERRFKTYDGQTRNPLDLTGCGMDDLRSQIAAIHAAEDGPRQAAANAFSGAIDPFTQMVDCSDCDSS